jgi:hypothetical protein
MPTGREVLEVLQDAGVEPERPDYQQPAVIQSVARHSDRALDPEAVWGKFARDSPLEGDGFELPVPREMTTIASVGEFLSPRAREEQCLPADPARSALARSLRTSDL